MNKKDTVIAISAAAVIVLLLIWWIKNQEVVNLKLSNKEKDKFIDNQRVEIQGLEVNHLTLIQELLKINKTLPELVKKQLIDLMTTYEVKNPKIANEIMSVVRLIEAQEYEKGVMSIAKIIENILKGKLQKEAGLKKLLISAEGKKRRAVFADYIEYARLSKIITKAESHFALSLKEFRNEEAHDLGVKRELNYNIGSMLTGIQLILKCDNYLVVPA